MLKLQCGEEMRLDFKNNERGHQINLHISEGGSNVSNLRTMRRWLVLFISPRMSVFLLLATRCGFWTSVFIEEPYIKCN